MRKIGLMMLALVLSAGVMAGCAEQKQKTEKTEKAPAQTEMAKTEKPAEAMQAAAPMAPVEGGQKAMDMASKAEGEAAMAASKAEKKVAAAVATVDKAAGEKAEEAEAMVKAAKAPAAPKNVEAGAAIFASKCSPCHGPGGKGTPMAPSFVGNGWVKDSERAQVADVIKNGRSGAAKRYKEFVIAMPANKLPDSDISALVDYLKSIN